MTRTDLSALAVVFAFGVGTALAGPEWKEDEDGGFDAGNVLQTAQNTTGAGALTAISGTLEGLNTGVQGVDDFEDAFLIQIVEPTTLQITTALDGGFAEFDSRIYLFDGESAAALLANDDTALQGAPAYSGTGLAAGLGSLSGSTVVNMSDDGTNIVITEPGIYLLAICQAPNGPTSGGSGMFTIENPTEVSGPDGPAPDGAPLGGWNEEPLGACFSGDACTITTEPVCSNLDGSWDEGGICPDPPEAVLGVCDLFSDCTETDEETCMEFGGSFFEGFLCNFTDETQIIGSCAIESKSGGFCVITTDTVCSSYGGSFLEGGDCGSPLGSCDFGGGPESESGSFCAITTEPLCDVNSGTFTPGGTCIPPVGPPTGGTYKIVLRGVSFSNNERPHPGWNWVDVARDWTANQPAYWSAWSGGPGPDGAGVPPFWILDPSADPTQQGRPANDGSDDRVLRGFIYAWAVDEEDREIAWNHLKGDVTIVNYQDGTAWEYNAWAVQAAFDPPTGSALDQDYILELNGVEYTPVFSQLLLDFYAPGSSAFGSVGAVVTGVDTHLTLHTVSADLRQETDGPYLTKASFVIWNEDETQFTNLHRCVTCWDQQLLSLYTQDGIQNHFLSLQSDKGKARIDGIASMLCSADCCMDRGVAAGCEDSDCQEQVCQVNPFCCTVRWDRECAADAVDLCDTCDALNMDAALLGVAGKELAVGVAPLDAAGANLIGMGLEAAEIVYEQAGSGGQPPTLQLPSPAANPGAGAGRARSAGGTATAPSNGSGADRVSGTEKGSLLIFSKVELRWTGTGGAIQDTFVDLTNDYGAPVRIKMYFVNGDAPTP